MTQTPAPESRYAVYQFVAVTSKYDSLPETECTRNARSPLGQSVTLLYLTAQPGSIRQKGIL